MPRLCENPAAKMRDYLHVLLILVLLMPRVWPLNGTGPSLRRFLSLSGPSDSCTNLPTDNFYDQLAVVVDSFRVLQLNMLADGLSGLRDDLGAFSRAKAEDLQWDNRKSRLLHEIVQYSPDVITLQECDHYYDFFFPELSEKGYIGLFAPKPSSACLEVSENSDGCAIFLKKDKFRVTFAEVSLQAQLQLRLSACNFWSSADLTNPPLPIHSSTNARP